MAASALESGQDLSPKQKAKKTALFNRLKENRRRLESLSCSSEFCFVFLSNRIVHVKRQPLVQG